MCRALFDSIHFSRVTFVKFPFAFKMGQDWIVWSAIDGNEERNCCITFMIRWCAKQLPVFLLVKRARIKRGDLLCTLMQREFSALATAVFCSNAVYAKEYREKEWKEQWSSRVDVADRDSVQLSAIAHIPFDRTNHHHLVDLGRIKTELFSCVSQRPINGKQDSACQPVKLSQSSESWKII